MMMIPSPDFSDSTRTDPRLDALSDTATGLGFEIVEMLGSWTGSMPIPANR
jgi:hypothetical protein